MTCANPHCSFMAVHPVSPHGLAGGFADASHMRPVLALAGNCRSHQLQQPLSHDSGSSCEQILATVLVQQDKLTQHEVVLPQVRTKCFCAACSLNLECNALLSMAFDGLDLKGNACLQAGHDNPAGPLAVGDWGLTCWYRPPLAHPRGDADI